MVEILLMEVVLVMVGVQVGKVQPLVEVLVCLVEGVILPVVWVLLVAQVALMVAVLHLVPAGTTQEHRLALVVIPTVKVGLQEVLSVDRKEIIKVMDLKKSKYYNKKNSNVEDRTLDPLPNIPDGTVMFGTGERYNSKDPATQQEVKDINTAKEVARLGKTKPIPTPTSRPKIIRTQVTPGKWKTF
jgi:hypothetical protein